jgi:hypothetical protein
MTTNELRPGDRVELHPATDWWMRGARYGEVVAIERKKVVIRLDRCTHNIKLDATSILQVI